MPFVYSGKKPELNPNCEINNYIQEIKMQERGNPGEGVGGKPVL